MFERFVKDAREAVAQARDAAKGHGHDHIGTGHMLIGVARGRPALTAPITAERLEAGLGDPGIDRDALASIGIDYEAVEKSVESSFGPGALASGRSGGQIPFSPESEEG